MGRAGALYRRGNVVGIMSDHGGIEPTAAEERDEAIIALLEQIVDKLDMLTDVFDRATTMHGELRVVEGRQGYGS